MPQDPASWLPPAFTDWTPWMQAVTLGLATLVQEDVPTVTAALLAGAGQLSWPAGYLGCFFGIWIGDLLLYLLARGLGRPLLRHPWIGRLATPESVARSERWFADRGPWILASSRFVPGTRLPTYLAAGLLRLPLGTFLGITGVMVAIWTAGIFVLAGLFGAPLATAWQRWNRDAWLLVAGMLLAVLVLRRMARTAPPGPVGRLRTALGRWRRWEFWPAWLFYLPVGLNYLVQSVRFRSATLPSAANPGIRTGGLVGESKFETLRDLMRGSPEFTAPSWLLPAGEPAERWAVLQRLLADHGMGPPYVLKPDLGLRGMGVRVIRSEAAAQDCLRRTPAALVVQRYVPGPLEAGVFYYRFPHEAHGRIFSITEKIFPELVGDGVRTVEELVWQDPRARYLAPRYLARFAARRREVLPAGGRLRLVEAGNHAQGCIFRDGSRWRTPELEARMDAISRGVPGFFIGRYDLRFESEADLRAGRNFQILELNGSSAEATSIYDARHTLGQAYATLFRQWNLVFAIGDANRRLGTVPMPLGELLRLWRASRRLMATYPPAD